MIEFIRKQFIEYKDHKMAYAGRLDPMAEGIVLILVGEECKNREKYERLSKQYEFEVLLGISTDSYDVMGLIEEVQLNFDRKSLIEEVKELLPSFVGKYDQPYPPFSSARVQGKPLYYWARQNKLSEIDIPSKEIEVYSLKFLFESSISSQKLFDEVKNRLEKVHGEFRQKEIMEKWHEALDPDSRISLPILKMKVTCSSGTYIRSIAHELGKKLGIPTLAFSIKRVQVGEFNVESAFHFNEK